ncbi:MAG: hypothetical protein ACLSVD_03075 [Eggerthellaceae bacterium]
MADHRRDLRALGRRRPRVRRTARRVDEAHRVRATRGALGAFRRPQLPSVADIVRGARRITVLEDITNHTNVGAIFRSAAALGIDAVLVTPAATIRCTGAPCACRWARCSRCRGRASAKRPARARRARAAGGRRAAAA